MKDVLDVMTSTTGFDNDIKAFVDWQQAGDGLYLTLDYGDRHNTYLVEITESDDG